MKIYVVKGHTYCEGFDILKAFTSEDKAKDLVEALIKFKENMPIYPRAYIVLSQPEIELREKELSDYKTLSPLPNVNSLDYFDSYSYQTIEVEE